ncbi:MAG: WYL domain-containing protein [Gammaproteobacteria bacterium]|nr:WYL domain-containing protein [Gammaproteobacteria bacterium]
MANKNHELMAYRFVEILTRWNEGEALDIDQLAQEFNTSRRTIERDLNERLAFLPYKKVNGKYSLDQSYLGKFNVQDIRTFAVLAGVSDLFPSLDRIAVRQLVDNQANSTYASKGYFFEDASSIKPLLTLLETAIKARHYISFEYKDNSRQVAPYKIVHHHNCWYLAAVNDDKLKTYRISRISNIQIESTLPSFKVDAKIVEQLDQGESIWFGTDNEKEEVILKVDPQVASHFSSRKLLPEQDIVKTLENGGLIVSSSMVNSLQILPLVRYWIPHLHIVSPESLKTEFEVEPPPIRPPSTAPARLPTPATTPAFSPISAFPIALVTPLVAPATVPIAPHIRLP